MPRLYIIGAGGHGRVVSATAEAAGFDVIGFFDDRSDLAGVKIDGYPVIGPLPPALPRDGHFVIAIGDCATRRAVAEG